MSDKLIPTNPDFLRITEEQADELEALFIRACIGQPRVWLFDHFGTDRIKSLKQWQYQDIQKRLYDRARPHHARV